MAEIVDTHEAGATRGRVMIVYPKTFRRVLGRIPVLAREWGNPAIVDRNGARDAWDVAMVALESTARQYMAGELPLHEQEEYLALLAETYKVLPLVERIGLSGPRLPEGHPDPHEAPDLG
jgi:hypothetical protein